MKAPYSPEINTMARGMIFDESNARVGIYMETEGRKTLAF
jgi:hypothetical protein